MTNDLDHERNETSASFPSTDHLRSSSSPLLPVELCWLEPWTDVAGAHAAELHDDGRRRRCQEHRQEDGHDQPGAPLARLVVPAIEGE